MMTLVASVAFFVLLSPALPAQPASPAQPVFRASSELVVLHVSVRDRSGRYITGLGKEHFTVIDDARPQTLEMFSADDVPATVGFLIDNSNSMRPSRERVIAASVAFANHSHPQDEIFVLTFNEAVRQVWGPKVVAEMDAAAFARAMQESIVARGMTAIYDGIAAGLTRLERAKHTRQVLIAVSDGSDNASKTTAGDAITRVHESDATVYTVALVDPLMRDGNPKLLRRLARETGGEFYAPRRIEDVSDAFEKIARDIRNAYTLAYVPSKSGDDRAPGPGRRSAEREGGRRRTIRVYVRSMDGRVLTVRTRDGYFEKTDEARR